MIKKPFVMFALIYLYMVFEKQWLLTTPDIGAEPSGQGFEAVRRVYYDIFVPWSYS